uniref:BUB1 N-terminal domain-containing protein n=1 Tax=Lygus hesperus TaxID=30085 RepID=A0A0K8TDH1_LYGHE
MANRVILSRKEQFVREVAAYRGDDPLKLRYEFLLWLDSNFGKDKVIDIFTSTLEEALNTHWNDARYKEDNRLIELQMIYATLQPNPLNVYQSYYDRGLAQQSSVLYVNWANHLAASGDFAGADKIYKMGCEKTSSAQKAELNKAFEKFLAAVGRKFLDGEMATEKLANCPKCHVQQSAAPAPAAEDVKAIEMNPGKAGCWEDFQTAVAYFDAVDVKSIRMYPKDRVYKDAGKEYSLEEIKASDYFEKLKKREQLQVQKLKEKTNKMSMQSFDPPCEADPVIKTGLFRLPFYHVLERKIQYQLNPSQPALSWLCIWFKTCGVAQRLKFSLLF